MTYSIKTTVEPATEAVTLEDAKQHLRVPGNHEDANIERIYIPAARRRIEAEIGRSLIRTTHRLSLEDFPAGSCPILLPRSPVISVASIAYVDSAGDSQVLSSEDYVVDTDSEPGRILPAWGTSWPTTRGRTAASTVAVTFDAGYGDHPSSVPAGLREAILLLVGHYYYHREEVLVGVNATILPRAVSDLVTSHGYGDEFADYGGGS